MGSDEYDDSRDASRDAFERLGATCDAAEGGGVGGGVGGGSRSTERVSSNATSSWTNRRTVAPIASADCRMSGRPQNDDIAVPVPAWRSVSCESLAAIRSVSPSSSARSFAWARPGGFSADADLADEPLAHLDAAVAVLSRILRRVEEDRTHDGAVAADDRLRVGARRVGPHVRQLREAELVVQPRGVNGSDSGV